MTYTAHRNHRFQYAHEVIEFIEAGQCFDCVFRNDDPEMPMFHEIAGSIVTEMPVEELEDVGNDGIVCTKYRQGDSTPSQVLGQLELFDV